MSAHYQLPVLLLKLWAVLAPTQAATTIPSSTPTTSIPLIVTSSQLHTSSPKLGSRTTTGTSHLPSRSTSSETATTASHGSTTFASSTETSKPLDTTLVQQTTTLKVSETSTVFQTSPPIVTSSPAKSTATLVKSSPTPISSTLETVKTTSAPVSVLSATQTSTPLTTNQKAKKTSSPAVNQTSSQLHTSSPKLGSNTAPGTSHLPSRSTSSETATTSSQGSTTFASSTETSTPLDTTLVQQTTTLKVSETSTVFQTSPPLVTSSPVTSTATLVKSSPTPISSTLETVKTTAAPASVSSSAATQTSTPLIDCNTCKVIPNTNIINFRDSQDNFSTSQCIISNSNFHSTHYKSSSTENKLTSSQPNFIATTYEFTKAWFKYSTWNVSFAIEKYKFRNSNNFITRQDSQDNRGTSQCIIISSYSNFNSTQYKSSSTEDKLTISQPNFITTDCVGTNSSCYDNSIFNSYHFNTSNCDFIATTYEFTKAWFKNNNWNVSFAIKKYKFRNSNNCITWKDSQDNVSTSQCIISNSNFHSTHYKSKSKENKLTSSQPNFIATTYEFTKAWFKYSTWNVSFAIEKYKFRNSNNFITRQDSQDNRGTSQCIIISSYSNFNSTQYKSSSTEDKLTISQPNFITTDCVGTNSSCYDNSIFNSYHFNTSNCDFIATTYEFTKAWFKNNNWNVSFAIKKYKFRNSNNCITWKDSQDNVSTSQCIISNSNFHSTHYKSKSKENKLTSSQPNFIATTYEFTKAWFKYSTWNVSFAIEKYKFRNSNNFITRQDSQDNRGTSQCIIISSYSNFNSTQYKSSSTEDKLTISQPNFITTDCVGTNSSCYDNSIFNSYHFNTSNCDFIATTYEFTKAWFKNNNWNVSFAIKKYKFRNSNNCITWKDSQDNVSTSQCIISNSNFHSTHYKSKSKENKLTSSQPNFIATTYEFTKAWFKYSTWNVSFAIEKYKFRNSNNFITRQDSQDNRGTSQCIIISSYSNFNSTQYKSSSTEDKLTISQPNFITTDCVGTNSSCYDNSIFNSYHFNTSNCDFIATTYEFTKAWFKNNNWNVSFAIKKYKFRNSNNCITWKDSQDNVSTSQCIISNSNFHSTHYKSKSKENKLTSSQPNFIATTYEFTKAWFKYSTWNVSFAIEKYKFRNSNNFITRQDSQDNRGTSQCIIISSYSNFNSTQYKSSSTEDKLTISQPNFITTDCVGTNSSCYDNSIFNSYHFNTSNCDFIATTYEFTKAWFKNNNWNVSFAIKKYKFRNSNNCIKWKDSQDNVSTSQCIISNSNFHSTHYKSKSKENKLTSSQPNFIATTYEFTKAWFKYSTWNVSFAIEKYKFRNSNNFITRQDSQDNRGTSQCIIISSYSNFNSTQYKSSSTEDKLTISQPNFITTDCVGTNSSCYDNSIFNSYHFNTSNCDFIATTYEFTKAWFKNNNWNVSFAIKKYKFKNSNNCIKWKDSQDNVSTSQCIISNSNFHSTHYKSKSKENKLTSSQPNFIATTYEFTKAWFKYSTWNVSFAIEKYKFRNSNNFITRQDSQDNRGTSQCIIISSYSNFNSTQYKSSSTEDKLTISQPNFITTDCVGTNSSCYDNSIFNSYHFNTSNCDFIATTYEFTKAWFKNNNWNVSFAIKKYKFRNSNNCIARQYNFCILN
ncbi:uncharacterized protein [Labrus bergylta]|uniref:uncharacterized protein n=1 Tax=Labrus bergylta TaxID=56723 RepID=UPI003313420C